MSARAISLWRRRTFDFDALGLETDNELIGNLGMLVRQLPPEDRVDGEEVDDKHDARSSVFWITNARNRFVGNVVNYDGGPHSAFLQLTDHPSYLAYSKNVSLVNAAAFRFKGGKIEDHPPEEQHHAFVDVDGTLFGAGQPTSQLAGAKAQFVVFDDDCDEDDGGVVTQCNYAVVTATLSKDRSRSPE